MDTINFVSSLRQQALLLGDYNAYRRMCTRRLAKLRKRLGRVTDPKKKEHKPAPVTAQDIAKDPRCAIVPVPPFPPVLTQILSVPPDS